MANSKKKKEVTLESLANTLEELTGRVARGFEGVEQRMATKDDLAEFKAETYTRLNEVDRKLQKIDYRVDELHDILARFEEGDILDLQKRVKLLERIVRAMSKRLE